MSQLLSPATRYLPHPLADIVPHMSNDEFRDLCKSIRDNGFLKEFPIILLEGKILDGRHRYRACLKEGVEPIFFDYTGPSPEAFVYAAIQGRNLTESTRALMAAKLLIRQKEKPKAERLSYDTVRRMYGIGSTIQTDAVRVVNNGVPELVKLIENGEIKVKQANEIIRLDKKEQEKVIAEGPKSVAAKAAQLSRLKQKGNPIVESLAPRAGETGKPDKQFDLTTDELLRDLRNMAARFTRYIQTSDGKRFRKYVTDLMLPWIDHSGVKIVDKGEGPKKQPATFVALRPIYRLLVAAARERAYPLKQLKEMLDECEPGLLDGKTPPIEPEDDPTQLVTPESL